MGIIKQLQQQNHFTEVEKEIAAYVLQHQDAVQEMGIVELAQQTYSSNATIIRLCRKLGLSGYKEFRIAFAADVEKSRRENKEIEINRPFGPHDSMNAVMKSVADISREAIDDCYALISPAKMYQAATILRDAKRIYIWAAGDSYTTSLGFSNLLMKIGRMTLYPAHYHESPQMTWNATSQDAALIISYSGTILQAIRTEIRMLKMKKVPIILISTLAEHPCTKYIIDLPDQEQVVGKAAGYYSQTAIRYVLNCLYGEIYSYDLQKNQEYKDKMDEYAYNGNGQVK